MEAGGGQLQPVKYPECLTISPFISILNINEFLQASFPQSPSHLSLISFFLSLLLNHSQAWNSECCSGTVSHTFPDYQLLTLLCVCVCMGNICVPAIFLSGNEHEFSQKPKKPICCNLLWRGLFLESGTGNNRVFVFFMCTYLLSHSGWELGIILFLVSVIFPLMGIHAVLPLVKHQQLVRNTNKTLCVWMQINRHTFYSLHCVISASRA